MCPTIRSEEQACRNKVLGWVEDSRGAHAGLILDRALRVPVKYDKHRDERPEVHLAARRALKFGQDIYEAAFARRLEWVGALKERHAVEDFCVETPSHQRLVIGLGNSSPLETGFTLHSTFGVPMIPGSALKGIASNGLPADGYERKILFGGTDDAGFITFHDAWISPQSITNDQQGLIEDVMTPHHGHYYDGAKYTGGLREGEIIPPTDFDDPTPITFLSVRGSFHVVLTCEDPGKDGERWLRRAKDVLLAALKSSGAGGKGSSGYGRLVEVVRQ